MPPGTGQVSCGGAQYIIAVGLGVFSKAAEGPAFMPDGGSIQVIYETTQFDDVVQDANVRRQQKGHATDLARSQCRGRTALEILQTETVSGIGALPNPIFCGGATVQRSLSERSRRTATRHPNRFPLDGLILEDSTFSETWGEAWDTRSSWFFRASWLRCSWRPVHRLPRGCSLQSHRRTPRSRMGTSR